MKWENDIWFIGLAGVVLLFFLLYLSLKRRKTLLFKNFNGANLELMHLNTKFTTDWYRAAFLMISLCSLILALANLQQPGKMNKVDVFGSDVVIALDISRSMLVTDIAPNRLSRSVRFLSDLIRQIQGERIGLVFFAGNAFVQMPLSTDHAAALMFLRNAHPDLLSYQGTAIGDALELSSSLFDDKSSAGRTVVLLSDGEDHFPESLKMAAKLKQQGVRILTLGIGTSRGGEVPFSSYESGEQQTVISAFNEANLKAIAKEGNGAYYYLDQDLDKILKEVTAEIQNMEKASLAMVVQKEYDSMFQYFLMIALMGYILYIIWPYPVNNDQKLKTN
jgi:Ca-activated chloride channel homolog